MYLLSISLGPVQGFIAAARKTRDLWFGSWLLSDLSRTVASALVAQDPSNQVELIFPHETALAANGPVANKILALVPDSPERYAWAARAAAERKLLACFFDETNPDSVRRRLSPSDWNAIDTSLAQAQIEQLLEFFAAWVPYESGRIGYREAGQAVEQMLAGRKALRDFPAAPSAADRSGRGAGSLDPSRESVIKNPRTSLQSVQIKPGELLDGVSLIKRVSNPRQFVSVARVAAETFVNEAGGRGLLTSLSGIAQALFHEQCHAIERLPMGAGGLPQYAAFPYDTQLFFGVASDADDLITPRHKELASAFYGEVQRLVHDEKIRPPTPYFCVLAADGDNMGQLLQTLKSRIEHQKLSEALAAFAAQAGSIVADNHGALVYSGGDDVLAFLPLKTSFECADQLSRAFTDRLEPHLPVRRDRISLSVGLSIGHQHEHLQTLLAWGRDAENIAKGRSKNALAVSLHTRSGGADDVSARHPWNTGPVHNRWADWWRWLGDGTVPHGVAYELRALLLEAKSLPEAERTSYAESGVLRREVKRILQRKKEAGASGAWASRLVDRLDVESAEDQLDELTLIVSEMLIARRIYGEMV